MAAVHGSIGPFDSREEDWTSSVERLDQYFVGNDVASNVKKRAILLSNCGPQTYQLLKNLVAPEKPNTLDYSELVEVLRRHWQPKPSKIVQRYHFHSRVQKDNESISEFVAELRKLAEHCEFADLEDMLRDRLVCGVKDSRIQKKLLAEQELTFRQAFETGQAMEIAEKNVKDIQIFQRPVHKIQEAQPQVQKESKFHHCGGRRHNASDCRYKKQFAIGVGERDT
jgi:hypothetical protein